MYFPTANIEINPFVPPAVAFIVSFFTSMGGVSGAFLLLPFQVSILGFTSPSVSATNQLFNIVGIPSGIYCYIKQGRMVWPLAMSIVLGAIPGVIIGALIRIEYFPDPHTFKMFVGIVLLYIGSRLLKDVLKKVPESQKDTVQDRGAGCGLSPVLSRVSVSEFSVTRIGFDFQGRSHSVNTLGLVLLSALVGMLGGVYGIGGGAIIAPFMVSFMGLPVYIVAGAALMGTFVTSIAGVVFYQSIASFYPDLAVSPDWMLGVMFGVGGLGGMYCGAMAQRFVPEKLIKWLLVGCILFVSLGYIISFFQH